MQAVTPASASDAPISLRKVRRATGSVIASTSEGNSLYSRSRKRIVRELVERPPDAPRGDPALDGWVGWARRVAFRISVIDGTSSSS